MRGPAWGALAVALMLAGCGHDVPAAESQRFDGALALEWVKVVALHADGSVQLRIPGTDGQLESATELWGAMAVPGWTRSWANGTGHDYLAMPKGEVEYYTTGSRCSDDDRARVEGLTFHNIVAIHRSAQPTTRLVLLGAHWDSQRHATDDPDASRRLDPDPGANDGASGVGLLLQLMRTLQDEDLGFDVGVILLDGEDGFGDCHPIAGSLLYAATLAPSQVDRFILLDMVGDPGARFPRESASTKADPALVDLLWSHGKAGAHPEFWTETKKSVLDDHLSFRLHGVPAIDIIDYARNTPTGGFPPQWNTVSDTVDKLDASALGAVGQALLDTLRDPAFASSWPKP